MKINQFPLQHHHHNTEMETDSIIFDSAPVALRGVVTENRLFTVRDSCVVSLECEPSPILRIVSHSTHEFAFALSMTRTCFKISAGDGINNVSIVSISWMNCFILRRKSKVSNERCFATSKLYDKLK